MRHLLALGLAGASFLGLAGWLYRSGSQELLLVLLSLAVAAPVVYLVRDRFLQQNALLEMREQALRAELQLLKNQLDPHFLFNTLNNLYGLTIAKSELAPQAILQLADLLRFTIYEGRKDAVPLEAEVGYLRSYLELQRLRIRAEQLDLRFAVEIDDAEQEIAPLLLIVLVENAVKHGLARSAGPALLHLRLTSREGRVDFEIENSRGDARATGPGGVGLANLRRRLELLYPGRHALEVVDGATYRVRLRLLPDAYG